MTDPARALLSSFSVHGGRLEQARAAFPAVPQWTDVSTGIAPWSYPIAPLGDWLERLPDPAALRALETEAADYFGTAPDRVVAVPGSDMALRLLGTMLPGRPAVIAPGYSGHCAMWPSREATIGASAQVAELADTHDALVLARPNNPDGWSADCAQLAQAAERLATRGGWLVLDEAFVDAAPGDSLAALDWPGLIILRSFGKFFGLAGLRLGFVVADPEIGARLRHLIGDWPISGPALAAGRAAYADRTWQAEQRKRLTEASGRLVCRCAEHDLEIVGSTAFFTLVRVPARDALFVHLAHHGVLTRPFSDQPDWLRIGLPKDKDDWARLTNALGRWRR